MDDSAFASVNNTTSANNPCPRTSPVPSSACSDVGGGYEPNCIRSLGNSARIVAARANPTWRLGWKSDPAMPYHATTAHAAANRNAANASAPRSPAMPPA